MESPVPSLEGAGLFVFALWMIPKGFFFAGLRSIALQQWLAEALVEVRFVLEAVVEVGVDQLQSGWEFVFVVPESAAHEAVYPFGIGRPELGFA